MKLKKGSIEAKNFMAKIRKLKKPIKTTITKTNKQVIGKIKKVGKVKKTTLKNQDNLKYKNYSISGKPTQIDNYNIDNYIALNKKYDETKRYIIQQRQKVKKLKGLEKKLQTFNLNIGINELINFNNQIKSYKKFYKIL